MLQKIHESMLEAFRAIVGSDGVRTDEAIARIDFGSDNANLNAGLMVCPSDVAEVAAVVAFCNEHNIAIVPHGGRSGLVGGGVSHLGEIILSLERMNRIARLDPIERVAVVEAGVTLEALQIAAAHHGLEPGIDLGARGSATIGGMSSTNAGGMMAFQYGVMRHRVLGLEAVLPNGEVYSDLTRVVKNAAGYDLKHLFIGAEGTLGVITKIVVKLEPLPRATVTGLLGLPSVAAALEVVRIAFGADGGRLRIAEAMWRPLLTLNADAHGWRDASVDFTQPIFLLLSLGGASESLLQAAFESIFASAFEAYPDASGVIASSQRQERELLLLREDMGVMYRAYPAAPSYDISVPLSEIDAYVARITRELAALEDDLSPFVFGHIADGNLHVVFNHEGKFDKATSAAVEGVLYRDLHALGGSFSAEHGVGSKRTHALAANAGDVKLASMKLVKQALDPKGIMNPGKVLG